MSPTKVNCFENLFSFVKDESLTGADLALMFEELKKFIVAKGLEKAKHL